jgi:hypothetical protein
MGKVEGVAGKRSRLKEGRPSPAMAVALLALVIAMSGTAIAATQLGKNSVGSRHIKPGAVTSSDLRNGGVRVADIGAGAVTTPKLGEQAVTAGKLAEGSVDGQALRAGAVGTAKLGDGAVSSQKLGLGAVLGANLANGSVLNDKIAAGAVNGESIADGALGTEDFSSAIPAASATATGDQSIPNEGNAKVILDSEHFDTRDMHSNTSENTKIVAPVDGVYMISGSVEWNSTSNAQGLRTLSIRKNDDFRIALDARAMDTHEANVDVWSQTVSTAAVLEAGDYIEMRVFHNTIKFPAETQPAVTLVNDVESTPELTMVWLAPGPA